MNLAFGLPKIPSISMPAITTDLIIAFVLVMVVLYGLLLGHKKLSTFALSVFVGIVMVLTFADGIFTVLQKTKLTFGGKVSLPLVKIGLFSLPVVALEFTKKDKGGRGNLTMIMLLSLATAALLVSSVFSFLDPAVIQDITSRSMLANWVYGLKLVWLAAVPVLVIVESFPKRKSH